MTSFYLSFIVLLSTVTLILGKAHDLIEGSRIPGDEIAVQENIKYSSRILRIRRETKTYNIEGFITYIKLFDRYRDGARARISGGGVGHTYVNIDFKSAQGRGIGFDLEIYKTKNWSGSGKSMSGSSHKSNGHSDSQDMPDMSNM